MLNLKVDKASKRFQYEWIFRDLSLNLNPGDSLAITGSNGSGKSTLIKTLSGAMPISKGSIEYFIHDKKIDESQWFSQLTFSAPYIELPEEFSLKELLQFHFKFKKAFQGISIDEMISRMYLEKDRDKQISMFSSGMKQRLKLGLALFSEAPLVFLDEPTSNLDSKGISWYEKLIEDFAQNRIILIATNEERDYRFCEQIIAMDDYK